MVPSQSLDLFRSYSGANAVVGVAVKSLATVDLPAAGSNQHELNGVAQLRQILGEDRIQDGRIRWYVLTDEDSEADVVDSLYTWYDARENTEGRTEYRLYYRNPNGLESSRGGDRVYFVALRREGEPGLLAYVVPAGSTWDGQLSWLFGIDELADSRRWAVRDPESLEERARQISSADLLEYLELERSTRQVAPSDFELVRRRFGLRFPTTDEFSAFAREEVGSPADPSEDQLLLAWIEREEELFRALEEYIVREKLAAGFADVDEFISFSLSVQNRRKSRMGYALENHLKAIFDRHGIRYAYNPVTENRSRPDFLFPGITEYDDEDFPADRLYMLAAKSTCKDRWRQVLSEADRVEPKHLCTLEPGISENQTEEMRSSRVRLVVPAPIHDTYAVTQREWLLSLESFLEMVG